MAETAEIPKEQRHKYYDAGATPFFFGLITGPQKCYEINARCIRDIIRMGVALGPDQWPNFVVRTLPSIGNRLISVSSTVLCNKIICCTEA